MRTLSRKKLAAWVNNGRTETWWLNMITRVSPDHEWRKNFHMTRENSPSFVRDLGHIFYR